MEPGMREESKTRVLKLSLLWNVSCVGKKDVSWLRSRDLWVWHRGLERSKEEDRACVLTNASIVVVIAIAVLPKDRNCDRGSGVIDYGID
jgi:hypothetical protein